LSLGFFAQLMTRHHISMPLWRSSCRCWRCCGWRFILRVFCLPTLFVFVQSCKVIAKETCKLFVHYFNYPIKFGFNCDLTTDLKLSLSLLPLSLSLSLSLSVCVCVCIWRHIFCNTIAIVENEKTVFINDNW